MMRAEVVAAYSRLTARQREDRGTGNLSVSRADARRHLPRLANNPLEGGGHQALADVDVNVDTVAWTLSSAQMLRRGRRINTQSTLACG
jgi:hypothetical protein